MRGGCVSHGRSTPGRPLLLDLKEQAMTQCELNRAVARATGESLSTIRRLGFGIADSSVMFQDPKPLRCRPRVVNWDRLDARRPGYLPQRSRWRREFV
jgi:hypothetical protein